MGVLKRKSVIYWILFSAIGLLIAGGGSAFAATVSFSPSEPEIASSQTVDVDIIVDAGVTDMHCFRVQIDSILTSISLINVTEGPLLQQAGNTFFFWESENGVYDIFNCLLGPGLVANGPGVLATMTFSAGDEPCTTPLAFNFVLFQDENLDTLNVADEGGTFSVAGCGSCDCPCHTDPSCDGVVNVFDVVAAVEVAFRSGTEQFDAGCPYSQTNANCDAVTNVFDVVAIVDVAFRGGDPLTQFCDPCAAVNE